MHANVPSYLRDHSSHLGRQTEGEEDSCPGFGFLRGLDVAALAVEFRLLSGNSEWYSYSCLVSFRFNPSVGLLLKFTGDATTLVLIQGSNLDATIGEAKVNLTDRGLQRHRIVYIREMSEDELKKARKEEPTIDRIDIAEFESLTEQRDWLKTVAPLFVRP